MSKLRNFFASINLCESTAEIARKPALIKTLVDYSVPRTQRPANMSAENYALRLHIALRTARNFSLTYMHEQNIAVCLDQRLGDLKSGFLTERILSVYYPEASQKILSLYDSKTRNGFAAEFNDPMPLNGGETLDSFVHQITCDDVKKTSIGFICVDHRSACFLWTAASNRKTFFQAHPQLLASPAAPAGASSAPVIQP